jgi:hypothetical protein
MLAGFIPHVDLSRKEFINACRIYSPLERGQGCVNDITPPSRETLQDII